MDASDFYNLSRNTGFFSSLSRVLVFFNQKIRPPYPFPARDQQKQICLRYFRNNARILLIGSNLPQKELKEFNSDNIIQIDIKKYEHVNVVADAEKMGSVFGANSFDYIVSSKMLEHTPHPWKVIEEVKNVLKPGGVFYLSVPWMFPVHGEPNDFHRFTIFSIRNMIKDVGLIEVESGSEYSPHSALYLFLKYYLSDVLSLNNSILFYSFEYIISWLLFPLGLVLGIFERLSYKRKSTGFYTDSILYIIAKKPELQ